MCSRRCPPSSPASTSGSGAHSARSDPDGRIESRGHRQWQSPALFPLRAGLVRAAARRWMPARFIALEPRRALDLRPVGELAVGRSRSPGGDPGGHGAVAARGGDRLADARSMPAGPRSGAALPRPLARTIVLALIGEEDMATRVIDIEVFPLSVLQPNSSTLLSLGQLVIRSSTVFSPPDLRRMVALPQRHADAYNRRRRNPGQGGNSP